MVPEITNLVVCDKVYSDPVSHSLTLLGVLHWLYAPSFPTHVSICLYIGMTGGKGEHDLILRVSEDKSGLNLGDILFKTQLTDPLAPAGCVQTVSFNVLNPGVLCFSILHKHELLKMLRVPIKEPVPVKD
jgi:hypothetical protein